jgi:hypothetical protein
MLVRADFVCGVTNADPCGFCVRGNERCSQATAEKTEAVVVKDSEYAYLQPPETNYPGPPAAPTFWVLEPTVTIATVEQVARVIRRCAECKRDLPDTEKICLVCAPELAAREEADIVERKMRMNDYIAAFCGARGLSFFNFFNFFGFF